MNTDILLARQAARRRAEAKRAVPNSAPSVAFVTHNLDEEVGKTAVSYTHLTLPTTRRV